MKALQFAFAILTAGLLSSGIAVAEEGGATKSKCTLSTDPKWAPEPEAMHAEDSPKDCKAQGGDTFEGKKIGGADKKKAKPKKK